MLSQLSFPAAPPYAEMSTAALCFMFAAPPKCQRTLHTAMRDAATDDRASTHGKGQFHARTHEALRLSPCSNWLRACRRSSVFVRSSMGRRLHKGPCFVPSTDGRWLSTKQPWHAGAFFEQPNSRVGDLSDVTSVSRLAPKRHVGSAGLAACSPTLDPISKLIGVEGTRGYVGLTARRQHRASTSAACIGELPRAGIKPGISFDSFHCAARVNF